MANDLFLFCTHDPRIGDAVSISVGQNPGRKRRVILSQDEATRLANRLMSVTRGGETRGVEKFGGL